MAETGSTVTVTYSGTPGATVNVLVTNPSNVTGSSSPVPEDGSTGDFPYALLLDMTGTYRLVFSDGTNVQTSFVHAGVPDVPLATVQDFEDQTGEGLTPDEARRVELVLLAISSDVRDYTGLPYPDPAIEPWLRAAVVDAAVELGAVGGAVDPRIAAYSVGETATTYRAGANYGYLTASLRARLPRRAAAWQTLEDCGDGVSHDTWYPIWTGDGWPYL
jgi:hypothetical protein